MNFKSYKSILFIVLILTLHLNSIGQAWIAQSNLPDSREGAFSFSLNGKVYWGGGSKIGVLGALDDFYEYNPTTDMWVKKGDLPNPIAYAVSFVINGKGYVGLGKEQGSGSSKYLTSLYQYDHSTDSWTKKADIPLGFGVISSAVFIANNKAYVLGGVNSNFASNGRLHEYDPAADKWTEKKGYPITNQGLNFCRMPFAFGINGKGYVSCGEIRKKSGVGTEYIKKTFEYDPVADSWTPKADFPGTERHNGAAFVIGDMGYCGLGTHRDVNYANVFFNDFYKYSPSADKWTKIADYPKDGKVHPCAAVSGNTAYVGGGSEWAQGYTDVWYKYIANVSVSSMNNIRNIVTYPNPAKDIIRIQSINKFSRYRIYNRLGVLVDSGQLRSDYIRLSSIANGTYFLELRSDSEGVGRTMFIKK